MNVVIISFNCEGDDLEALEWGASRAVGETLRTREEAESQGEYGGSRQP